MSREFGEYGGGGYFHDKVRGCLEDLQSEAREKFHKEFIPLFESLYEIAYAISSVEACDSCLDRSITTTMEELPKIKKTIAQLEDTIRPYKNVADNAVREYIRSKEK
ncbi:MAG: hypothetical protein HC840_10440 [Leptolyngbyaceae cyanobacterium RM2_2_4]|nr:hypothetical protein [Leptolyngbyaceae cyanobacterium RM2_2_4]